MKTELFLLLLIGLTSTALGASAPRGSFTAGEYEAAKAKAIETGKPIAIVITAVNSSCPKCLSCNEQVFKEMKSDYVLVINDQDLKERLPAQVGQSTLPIYKSKGNFMPIVAVLSPTDGKLLGGLSYKQISEDGKKAFKTMEKEIAENMAAQPVVEEVPEAKPSSGMREWTNSEGKTIKAEALSSTETSVSLKLENGKVVDYPMDKLSEESRKLVKEATGSD